MTTSAISVHQITKTYGEGDIAVNAVRDVDLEVQPGEVLLIMGPSGSGKTTLLLMLGAMLRPTSGSIVIDGIDLANTPERHLPALRAHHLGFIFQDFNLLSALTALENVELACNLANTTGRAAMARATDLLQHVGLGERLHFRPDQLSGGEKQRVAIARALANRPNLVLADEPTANLDSGHGRDIARLLRQLAHEQQCSIVIVSHDERLREIADRVLWLEDGAFRQLDTMVTDPVCAMAVHPGNGTPHYLHDGVTYWFCSPACRQDFAVEPEKYVRRTQAQPGKASPAGALHDHSGESSQQQRQASKGERSCTTDTGMKDGAQAPGG
jgi:putative ABC transport system ATP-binding protein